MRPRIAAALTLALLAPALGGGTSPLAVALLLTGIGVLAVALPGRGAPRGYLIGAGLLLLAALDWTWPARLNALPWRAWLGEAGFPQGWSSSPEPWASVRAWLLLLGGLVWAGWCAGQAWTRAGRRRACEGLAAGIGVIALASLAAGRGMHVPGWPPGTGLGPFANRNQTANLFALGAFLTVVCGAERFRARRRREEAWRLAAFGIGWLCLLGMYTAALAVNRSRAGPLLFAGMTAAWLLTVKPPWKRRPETLAAAAAAGLLLGTVFLLTGRGVLTRLATSGVVDFRLKIFSDTLRLIRGSPWTGAGLGCFNVIFPMYRSASILQERVLHPESDWLWLTAEAGLPGLLAAAGLAAWMGMRAWRRLADRRDREMQLALCVACLGVAVHGLFDVAGHRLGTVMPALLLLGLAAGAEEGEGAGWVLRGGGVATLLAGGGCLAALALRWPMPLANGEQLLEERAAAAEAAGAHPAAEAMLGKALEWTPLDWTLYVERAEMEGRHGELTAALGDFRRARFLEPDYAGLPFDEGMFWLYVAPRFACESWEEALRRLPAGQRPQMYQNILAHAYEARPKLHAELWGLGLGDPAMELVYLGWAAGGEFQQDIGQLTGGSEGLNGFSAPQLRELFALWMERGESGQLAALLARHAEWLKAGYQTLADYDAAHGEQDAALDLMERYLPPPRLPAPPAMTQDEAGKRFETDPGDFAAGMALYYEAAAAGRSALETLEAMSALKGCPAYVYYLEAQSLIKAGRKEEAWKALERYAPRDQPAAGEDRGD